MKTSTVLVIGAAAIAGYYYAKRRVSAPAGAPTTALQATPAAVAAARADGIADPGAGIDVYDVWSESWGPPSLLVGGFGGRGPRRHGGRGGHGHGHGGRR